MPVVTEPTKLSKEQRRAKKLERQQSERAEKLNAAPKAKVFTINGRTQEAKRGTFTF